MKIAMIVMDIMYVCWNILPDCCLGCSLYLNEVA